MTMPHEPRRRPGDREHRLHDVDLVAAYAGDDPGIDRDAAAALVAACSDCRSEYELQREVANWMSGAPIVTLADGERSTLHERINRAIAQPTVVSLADRRARRQPGQLLFRIGTAAAALAVIAGLGGVFNLGGDNDGGLPFQTIASELAAGSEATTTAAAGATITTAASFAAASAERTMLTGGDAEAVNNEIEEMIGRAAAPDEAGVPEDSQADAMIDIPPCSDEVEDRDILLTAESVLDGEPIVVFVVSGEETPGGPSSESASPEALVFYVDDCSVVDLG